MNYNKEDVYKEKIEPLITELKQVCNREQLPIFISCCIANDENQSLYKTEMLSPTTMNLPLTDDTFHKYIDILNGFQTVPKKEIVELEF